MKTFSEIYKDINSKFYDKSNIDVEAGTVIDSYLLASSEGLYEAHQEIEDNKNPHLYSNLSGSDLDDMGYYVNCPRVTNEADDSYRYRLMQWNVRNEASNSTAIETSLMNMTYASYVTYVPYTEGVGTATAYIIPKSYDDATIENAIAETKTALKKVVSPGSYINYVIPDIIPVRIVAYIGVNDDGDLSLVEENIKTNVTDYINSIAVGDYLKIGEINKLGVNEPNVNYFNVVQLYVNDKATTSLSILQKLTSKLLFDDIIWWTAV